MCATATGRGTGAVEKERDGVEYLLVAESC